MQEQFLKSIEEEYCLICRACSSKVLDPDKKKSQIFLEGHCPSCKQLSFIQKTKKQRKRERKEARKQQRLMEVFWGQRV